MSVDPLLKTYQAEAYFKTYPGERNPSISVNCNVLICLLTRDNPALYSAQITKILLFVCRQAIGDVANEKWVRRLSNVINRADPERQHVSELYWQMLLSQAFALLYSPKHTGLLRLILDTHILFQEDIPQISYHILVEMIGTRQTNGSWADMCEVTAYAVLTLSFLSRLPWIATQGSIIQRIRAAMEAGKSYLLMCQDQWSHGQHIWVEKVTYASAILSETYCIAAVAAPLPAGEAPSPFRMSSVLPEAVSRQVQGAHRLIQATPLFTQADSAVLDIAVLQAQYSLAFLQRQRLDIFPRDRMGEDKYLAFIPLTWTACRAINGGSVSFGVLREMMVMSMLNYQVDEFMETAIQETLAEELHAVRAAIREIFRDMRTGPEAGHPECRPEPSRPGTPNGGPEIFDIGRIKSILSRYVTHILCHAAVLESPARLRQWLATELESFLLAHVTQAADNHQLRSWRGSKDAGSGPHPTLPEPSSLEQTFYRWVHGTSADHTSCPFSFVFYLCLAAAPKGGRGAFATPKVAYVAEDLCCHLASMCRIYNDYGSVARDREEANLNSLDFPEFGGEFSTNARSEEGAAVARTELMWIAEYERRGLESAFGQLRGELEALGQKKVVAALQLFYHVTDLYGLIYIQRDIATRLKQGTGL